MSTADKLNKLITTKSAIKEAILNKGVTVTDTDTFASYADKISSITSGGGGLEFDFTVLGYNLEECKDANDIANAAISLGDFTVDLITEAIAYGKLLYDSNYKITNNNVDKDKLLFYPKLELPYMYNNSKVLYIPNVEYKASGSISSSAYTNRILYKVGSINAVFTNSQYSEGFFNGCYSLREVGDINITGKAISYNNFFKDCYTLRKIGNMNTTGSTNFSYMFSNCSSLTTIPQLNTSSGTNFLNMFGSCTADVDGLDFSNDKASSLYNLPFYSYEGKRVSNIKTGKITSQYFANRTKLESATNIDASASTDYSFYSMFGSCSKLKEVSFTSSTSHITNFRSMFDGCSSLTTIPQLDTSSGTNFSLMLSNCKSLTTIPQLNTSSGTNFLNMFSGCYSLTTIPELNTSSGTNFLNMFIACSSLTTIPQLNTSSGTNFSGMFDSCSKLIKFGISIELLNTTISYSYFTGYSSNSNLRYALLKGLGTGSNMTSADFTNWPNWGVEDETIPESVGARQSLIDSLLTYSFDRATAGYSTCTISLMGTQKALLTEDEIAQITAKGYTIA